MWFSAIAIKLVSCRIGLEPKTRTLQSPYFLLYTIFLLIYLNLVFFVHSVNFCFGFFPKTFLSTFNNISQCLFLICRLFNRLSLYFKKNKWIGHTCGAFPTIWILVEGRTNLPQFEATHQILMTKASSVKALFIIHINTRFWIETRDGLDAKHWYIHLRGRVWQQYPFFKGSICGGRNTQDWVSALDSSYVGCSWSSESYLTFIIPSCF